MARLVNTGNPKVDQSLRNVFREIENVKRIAQTGAGTGRQAVPRITPGRDRSRTAPIDTTTEFIDHGQGISTWQTGNMGFLRYTPPDPGSVSRFRVHKAPGNAEPPGNELPEPGDETWEVITRSSGFYQTSIALDDKHLSFIRYNIQINEGNSQDITGEVVFDADTDPELTNIDLDINDMGILVIRYVADEDVGGVIYATTTTTTPDTTAFPEMTDEGVFDASISSSLWQNGNQYQSIQTSVSVDPGETVKVTLRPYAAEIDADTDHDAKHGIDYYFQVLVPEQGETGEQYPEWHIDHSKSGTEVTVSLTIDSDPNDLVRRIRGRSAIGRVLAGPTQDRYRSITETNGTYDITIDTDGILKTSYVQYHIDLKVGYDDLYTDPFPIDSDDVIEANVNHWLTYRPKDQVYDMFLSWTGDDDLGSIQAVITLADSDGNAITPAPADYLDNATQKSDRILAGIGKNISWELTVTGWSENDQAGDSRVLYTASGTTPSGVNLDDAFSTLDARRIVNAAKLWSFDQPFVEDESDSDGRTVKWAEGTLTYGIDDDGEELSVTVRADTFKIPEGSTKTHYIYSDASVRVPDATVNFDDTDSQNNIDYNGGDFVVCIVWLTPPDPDGKIINIVPVIGSLGNVEVVSIHELRTNVLSAVRAVIGSLDALNANLGTLNITGNMTWWDDHDDDPDTESVVAGIIGPQGIDIYNPPTFQLAQIDDDLTAIDKKYKLTFGTSGGRKMQLSSFPRNAGSAWLNPQGLTGLISGGGIISGKDSLNLVGGVQINNSRHKTILSDYTGIAKYVRFLGNNPGTIQNTDGSAFLWFDGTNLKLKIEGGDAINVGEIPDGSIEPGHLKVSPSPITPLSYLTYIDGKSFAWTQPYTQGTGIIISSSNVISATGGGGGTAYIKGNGIEFTAGTENTTISAKIDGSTLALSAGGLKIADGGVGTTQLANNAVTRNKILDLQVNTNKLASNAVAKGKIKNGAVWRSKLGASGGNSGQVLGWVDTEDVDSGLTWVNKGGGGTTYKPGTGIEFTGTNNDTIGIADEGVGTDQLADEAVLVTKIGAAGGEHGRVLTYNKKSSDTTATITWNEITVPTYAGSNSINVNDNDVISVKFAGADTTLGRSKALQAIDNGLIVSPGGIGSYELANNAVDRNKLFVGTGGLGKVLGWAPITAATNTLPATGGLAWVDNSGSGYVHPESISLTNLTVTGQTTLGDTDLGGHLDAPRHTITALKLVSGLSGITTIGSISSDSNISCTSGKMTCETFQSTDTSTVNGVSFSASGLNISGGNLFWKTTQLNGGGGSGTTYSAGTGIEITGTNNAIGIKNNGVTSTQIANNAVIATKLHAGTRVSGYVLTAAPQNGGLSWTNNISLARLTVSTSMNITGSLTSSLGITALRYTATSTTQRSELKSLQTENLLIKNGYSLTFQGASGNELKRGGTSGTELHWRNKRLALYEELGAGSLTDGSVNKSKLSATGGTNGQVLTVSSVTGGLSWTNKGGGGGTTYSAGNGINFTVGTSSTSISVDLDGSTLALSGSGLKIKDSGVGPTQLDISNSPGPNKFLTIAAGDFAWATPSGSGDSGITTLNEGTGIDISGSGNSRTIAVDLSGSNGISVSGKTISIQSTGLTAAHLAAGSGNDGQVLTRGSGNNIGWTNKGGGSGPTYSAGVGIQIDTDNSINIKDLGVGASQLEANSITPAKMRFPNTHGTGKFLTLDSLGTSFVWSLPDLGGGSGTTYSAGSGISISGNTISIKPGGVTDSMISPNTITPLSISIGGSPGNNKFLRQVGSSFEWATPGATPR